MWKPELQFVHTLHSAQWYHSLGLYCNFANFGWCYHKPSYECVCVPASAGHINSAVYSSLKKPINFLQPGLDHVFLQKISQADIISEEKKLYAAKLLSNISNQSIVWWAGHIYYLIYHPESAATLTPFTAGSYQLPQISRHVIYNSVNNIAVWRRRSLAHKSVKNSSRIKFKNISGNKWRRMDAQMLNSDVNIISYDLFVNSCQLPSLFFKASRLCDDTDVHFFKNLSISLVLRFESSCLLVKRE